MLYKRISCTSSTRVRIDVIICKWNSTNSEKHKRVGTNSEKHNLKRVGQNDPTLQYENWGWDRIVARYEISDGKIQNPAMTPDWKSNSEGRHWKRRSVNSNDTGKVSSLDSSWGLCASRLNWEEEKEKKCLSLSVPLGKGDRVEDLVKWISGCGTCRIGVSRGLLCERECDVE